MDSDEEHPCGRTDVRVVLRGATNVWFADTRSSIYIPTDDEQATKKIIAILDEFFDVLSAMRVDGEWNRGFIDMLAERHRVDKSELYNAFIRRDQGLEGLPDVTEEISEDEYRLAEYNVLIKSSGGDAQRFHSKNYPISCYDPVISKYFKSISLVHKLQETRAFVGFSRAEPNEMPISERKKMLRLGSENWLPAIQVHGEGIFFEFNKEAVAEWAQRPAVLSRLRNLQDSFRSSKFGANAVSDLRPEFVLIHTFAHLIINQLSFECGYGSSSIRERIYCEKADKPDIVLPKYKTVIFVNGCFWHGHTGCKYFVWPKNNEEFWKQKIGRNMERDAEVHQLLKDMGWFVIDVWECELKKNNAPQTLENLVKQLKTRPDSAHKK
jgi:DNA mismatch endonuclease Vsr